MNGGADRANEPAVGHQLRVKDLRVGGRRFCAVLEDGAVMCHGHAAACENGGWVQAPTLARTFREPMVAIDVADDVTCGVSTEQEIHCVLSEVSALGSMACRNVQTRGANVHSVAVGGSSVCGLGECGEVRCWSLHHLEAAGERVPLPVGASALSSSGRLFCAAMESAPPVACWGLVPESVGIHGPGSHNGGPLWWPRLEEQSSPRESASDDDP